jgi:hypothetical protein
MSTLQQNWRKGQNRFCLEVREMGGGEEGGEGQRKKMTQTMYAHMNKLIKKKCHQHNHFKEISVIVS